RQSQSFRQFLRNHLLRIMAEHHVNFMLRRIQVIEQALRVNRSAGSGDGNKNFHSFFCCEVWVRKCGGTSGLRGGREAWCGLRDSVVDALKGVTHHETRTSSIPGLSHFRCSAEWAGVEAG